MHPPSSDRTGDVRSFNELMTQWERVFISKGTYLLMEKCLMLVYRNLVKKMSVGSLDHTRPIDCALADVLNKLTKVYAREIFQARVSL